MKYQLLDSNQQPKPCTPEQWSAWMNTDPDMGVDYTSVNGCAVGTKFLCILTHDDAPCWETLVVGGAYHNKREVCSGNRDQAEAMHREMVHLIMGVTPPLDDLSA